MSGYPVKNNRPKKKQNLDDEDAYTISSPAMNDETINPCIQEQNLVTKCMYLNDHNKTKCINAFDNYNLCNKFWKYVSWQRWINGIHPHLPPPGEEREQAKKEMIHCIVNKKVPFHKDKVP